MRFLLLFTLALSLSAFAQVHQHTPDTEPVKIDLTKLPPPQPISGIGHSHIAITTKSVKAQQWFDQGLALMHCFWDYEALRSFEEALRNDPDCAICHWGVSRELDFRGGGVRNSLSKS